MIVELSFAGVDWLVREILKEAGDAAVLEPEDAREAVRPPARSDALARGARRAAPGVVAAPAPLGAGGSARDSVRARVSRREQIRMSDAEVAAFLARAAHRHLRDDRAARLAAPDAAVVRAARPPAGEPAPRLWAWTYAGLAEGAQPRARPARDAAGRGGRVVSSSCAA